MWSLKYGYARVSTSEQDHAGQVDVLSVAGAVKVFSEKISGVRTDRPQLSRAIAALDQGDVLGRGQDRPSGAFLTRSAQHRA
jgi:DNA invertase Pin-like site-specific DNA recombinase